MIPIISQESQGFRIDRNPLSLHQGYRLHVAASKKAVGKVEGHFHSFDEMARGMHILLAVIEQPTLPLSEGRPASLSLATCFCRRCVLAKIEMRECVKAKTFAQPHDQLVVV